MVWGTVKLYQGLHPQGVGLVLPGLPIGHQAEEFCLDQLAIKVCDGILERVLVALEALALVSASLKASSQNWNTLEKRKEYVIHYHAAATHLDTAL